MEEEDEDEGVEEEEGKDDARGEEGKQEEEEEEDGDEDEATMPGRSEKREENERDSDEGVAAGVICSILAFFFCGDAGVPTFLLSLLSSSLLSALFPSTFSLRLV